MSTNIIAVKSFLGKYYAELLHSTLQDKYKDTGLSDLFEQRFFIQNNKVQMIIDPFTPGLSVTITGNEIHVSKELYDHKCVVVSNSLEHEQHTNPRSLYSPATFSTVAYLVCQNHITFTVIGEVEEPIYVKYYSDYETFHNSIVTFSIENQVEVEIIEEIESLAALNSVVNYYLCPGSTVKLSTFYNNRISAMSYFYRNITARESSIFSHMLLGRGSSDIIDENKIQAFSDSKSEFLGIICSEGRKFHSILTVEPSSLDYSVDVDYRDILTKNSKVSFMPIMLGQQPSNSSSIEVSNLNIDDVPPKKLEDTIKEYLSPILDRAVLDRTEGHVRFYENKSKFLRNLVTVKT